MIMVRLLESNASYGICDYTVEKMPAFSLFFTEKGYLFRLLTMHQYQEG